MKVYISGQMTGLPDFNYPAFHAAAAAWRAKGWKVINPAEHFGGDQRRTYVEYVDADLKALMQCDAIAMLPGWDAPHARGSVWERAIALQGGLPVYDAATPVALPYENDPRADEIFPVDFNDYLNFLEWSKRQLDPAPGFDDHGQQLDLFP